jgi:hypothetical protein
MAHLPATPPESAAPTSRRTVIRSCRFSSDEWASVQSKAAALGLSPSRFLRHVALGTSLGRRIDAQAVVALNRVGVNLNHLVKLALRDGQPLVAAEASQVLTLLRDQLRRLL